MVFILGGISTIKEVHPGRTWARIAFDKVNQNMPNIPFVSKKFLSRVTGQEAIFPQSIPTLRYSLEVQFRYPLQGQYQISLDSNNRVIAIDRQLGSVFQLSDNSKNVQAYGNVFDLIALKESPKFVPIRITDLHYAFGKFFLGVTLKTSDDKSESLAAYTFSIVDSKIASLERFFMTPSIEDRQNPAMWGGRFTNSDSEIYFSVGEQRYDRSGFPKLSRVAISERANAKSVFGSVMKFSPNLKNYYIFAKGLRNAQGLYYSRDDNLLYASEHGPTGGDEVNILQKGGNYGWPNVSLGNAYGWPVADGQLPSFDTSTTNTQYEKQLLTYGFLRGTHIGYLPPLMSWIPSVGASQLMQIPNNSSLKDWRGDLLVATMAETSLHRLILSEQRIISDEKIPIGFRIRDMLIDSQGRTYISTDENQIVQLKLVAKSIYIPWPRIK